MPAPWTFDDLPDTGDPSFNEEARDAFAQWQSNYNEGMASKAEIDHTHGEGGVVLSLVANEAALGTGATDGELKICQGTYGNRYTWDDDNSKWRVGDGNKYATGDLPTTAYTIETGTRVFDVTVGAWQRWSGSAWVADGALSLVADEAALGTGATDGELKICQDTYGNRYTWDDDNSKWRVGDGNKYATGDLPTTAYTIETGTLVFDVTVGAWMRWTGSAWIENSAHRLVAKASGADSPYAVTADDLAGNTEVTNTGSVGEMVFNLPAGFANAKLKARITVAQAMTFNADGSQKFRFRGTQGSAGGSISSATIGCVAIIAWTGSDWGLELLGPWDYT